MDIEIFSYLSSKFLPKSSKIFPKTSKNPYSSSSNFCISLKTRIHPFKKIGPAGGNCIPYFHMFWRLGSEEDDWGWRWQEIRQRPVF